MHQYIKKLLEKIDTLPHEKILHLCKNFANELLAQDNLLDNLGIALIAVDKNEKVTRINRLAASYLAKKPFNKPIGDVLLDSDMALYAKNCCNSGLTTSKKEFAIDAGESTRYLTLCVISTDADDGKARLIKIEDTTNAHLFEIAAQRQRANDLLTRAAANMAHDIKNPLGAISIHVQLMAKAVSKARQRDGTLPEKKFLDDHISIVNDEIERLNSIVTSFLFATRPLNAQITATQIEPILRNIATFYAVEFNKSKIDFVFTAESKTDDVLIDEKLFRTVIVNLIQNSFEALSDRANRLDAPKVDIVLTQKGDKVIVSISDNGCGIPINVQSHIFEPYYTTKVRGTGLGLATCCKIIRNFDGEISVDSKEGVGTTFYIALPAKTKVKLLESNCQ